MPRTSLVALAEGQPHSRFNPLLSDTMLGLPSCPHAILPDMPSPFTPPPRWVHVPSFFPITTRLRPSNAGSPLRNTRLCQQYSSSYLYDAYGRSFAYGLPFRLAALAGYESDVDRSTSFPSRDFVTALRVLPAVRLPARIGKLAGLPPFM